MCDAVLAVERSICRVARGHQHKLDLHADGHTAQLVIPCSSKDDPAQVCRTREKNHDHGGQQYPSISAQSPCHRLVDGVSSWRTISVLHSGWRYGHPAAFSRPKRVGSHVA